MIMSMSLQEKKNALDRAMHGWDERNDRAMRGWDERLGTNTKLRCPRCGNVFMAAVLNLEWIRCPKCGKGVNVKWGTVKNK